MQKQRDPKRSLRNLIAALVALAILVIYAYGFQVTKIDLEKPKEPQRQSQLTNIVRGLANPRLVEYDEERVAVDAQVMMPCDESVGLTEVDTSGRYLELTPDCVELGGEVQVEGFNFEPGETVYLYFVPKAASIHEQIELRLATEPIEVGPDGRFSYLAEMRSDRASDEPQVVRALVLLRSGLPKPSKTLEDTVDKIIETVFLALIATTLGTLLAAPLSFLAARNLMINIVNPFGSVMGALLVAPFGWLVGSELFSRLRDLGSGLADQAWLALLLIAACVVAVWLVTRLLARDYGGRFGFLAPAALLLVAMVAIFFALGLLGNLGMQAGAWMEANVGVAGFLGNFVFVLSDLLLLLLPMLGGIIGLFIFSSFASRFFTRFLRRAPLPAARIASAAVAALAGAVLTAVLFAAIAWLYEVEDLLPFMAVPVVIVAGILLAVGLLVDVERPLPTGMVVYNITRTILNILRAIEPLIMVVAFAVWVGIGPFAGVMALALHTIASLGKLYSEQVENILVGPIEAVTATGANHLQTIVYAVVPQIIPPYLAFTIYRWDINVRMSTIIGFAGGGGVGFLVQQNLNLLKYRDAAVQMIAIAIVVIVLDYASARVRERII